MRRGSPVSLTSFDRKLIPFSGTGTLGSKIVPPMPGFYSFDKEKATLNDVVNFAVGKALDVFGIENNLYKRWEYV